MAIEKWVESNAKKIGNQFKLLDDGDTANVIFLYRSIEDVLRGSVHYLKASNYTGDVFCLGADCPACKRGVRLKNKLFIPLFNLDSGKFEIWYIDESFMNVLRTNVFKVYPNPSEIVFQITRHGAHGDVKTQYQIIAIGKNGSHPYDKLIIEQGINIEAGIDEICKEFDAKTITAMLNEYDANRQSRGSYRSNDNASSGSDNYGNLPNYQVTPRGASNGPTGYDISDDDYDDLPEF